MKRINIIGISIMLYILVGSCEDNLDLNPRDKISTPTFWKKKADFEQALTAIYGQRKDRMFTVDMGVWDCLTDLGYGKTTSEIVSGNITPSTNQYISAVYANCYSGIARINLFLKQLSEFKGTDLTDEDKKRMEAEARFHRSFYYFQLYMWYGDVPLVLTPLTVETMIQPKVNEDLIFDQIITDLDFGIANLLSDSYVNSKGRAVKSSAQAFKARALIFKAYGKTGVPDLSILTQVKSLCDEIKTSGYYSLSPLFSDVFQDAKQKGNKEIIYSVNFLKPDNTIPWDLYYGDHILASPLPSFVADFECTDGLPWGQSPLTDLANPMKNRDSRLKMTVFKDKPDWGAGKIHNPTNSRPTGYGVIKFCVPENVPYGYSTLSQQDAVILRYADVLLMYAEAQNEIEGPDASVYDAINTIRKRVDMPVLPNGLSKDQMREKIRHERKIEMAFEGLRYFDLKRWRIAKEVLNSVKDGILVYKFEDKFYKWPLPQYDIDLSQGVLIQNSDYQ